VRRIKSPREIEYIRQAGRYCEASFDAAVSSPRHLKPGGPISGTGLSTRPR
jgi:Xaa-Pro aminopeptidase